ILHRRVLALDADKPAVADVILDEEQPRAALHLAVTAQAVEEAGEDRIACFLALRLEHARLVTLDEAQELHVDAARLRQIVESELHEAIEPLGIILGIPFENLRAARIGQRSARDLNLCTWLCPIL